MPERRRPWWPVLVLALAALFLLYADALDTGFLNDDYLFLEEARTRPLASSLAELGALGNYYRPLSRQIYFEALTPVAGGHPRVFHAVNFGLYLAALVLLADLLRALLPVPGVMAGSLYFALLPFQRVNLTWVSCSQDLLALMLSLGSLALFRRGRDGWAVIAYLGAVFSKESALPLPLALAAWALWVERRGEEPRRPDRKMLVRRLIPFLAVATAWAAAAIEMRARHRAAAAFLHFDTECFLAAYVHGVQSLLGLEHPVGIGASLLSHGPALLPLLALAVIGLWVGAPPGARAPEREGSPTAASLASQAPEPEVGGNPTQATRATRFGLAWLVAFGIVIGPVVATWSSYYYTLFAVGAALLVGRALRGISFAGWLALSAGLLWWHAGSNGTRAFAVAERPWGWTSHLTSFYFQRAASLTDTLTRQLARLEPTPPHGTRFFFATLPPYAGFQMGNGALLRALYRDPSIESYFYSQFSESTATDHPCRILYWDGRYLGPLYGLAREPFFQVGSDLLLFDRPAGAAHAFRRGLRSGENPVDHLYWLGWTELWLGRRAGAEAAWRAFGARDDTLQWFTHMRMARTRLVALRDTLGARRELAEAIRRRIGHPDAHAVLGHLLLAERPKYGLLELKVAVYLKPDDWLARRDLLLGLVDQRLDDPARRELAGLERIYPGWSADPLVTRARETLERRSPARLDVVQF